MIRDKNEFFRMAGEIVTDLRNVNFINVFFMLLGEKKIFMDIYRFAYQSVTLHE